MSGGTIFVSSASIATATGRNRGVPPTQGDKFTDPRTLRIIEQKDRRIKAWRALIALQVRIGPWTPIPTGPVACTLEFLLPRPQHHYRTGTHAGELKPAAPLWHTSKPDIDKLTRAVLDGLTQCGAIGDDAQVCLLVTSKRYTTSGDVGVRIRCEQINTDALDEPMEVPA